MMVAHSPFATPPSVRRGRAKGSHDNVRGSHRVIGAAILAGGLALSVSIHPMQRGHGLVDALLPGGSTFSGAPEMAGSTHPRTTLVDFSSIQLPDLVGLVKLTERHPEVSTGALLELAGEFGVRSVVRSFELLSSLGPVQPLAVRISYGAGSYVPTTSGTDAWHSLMSMLALLQSGELTPGRELFEALRALLSELVGPVVTSRASSASPPATDISIEGMPPHPSPPAVASRTASDLPTADPPAAPAPVANVAAPVQTPDTTPTESFSAPSNEPSVTPSVVETSSAPKPPVVVQPEPDPPQLDPPKIDPPRVESTPSSGPNTEPTGSTNASSPSSSGASSGSSAGAGDSGGGSSSASNSGGGSAGGE